MDNSRRKFLKIAGLSAIAGIGAPTAFSGLLKGEALASAPDLEENVLKGEVGKRYGIVIDVRKFAEDKALAQRCIKVCHSIHNVPDYGNKKDEIKWLWTDGFENVFPDHSHYKKNTDLHEMPILTLCNHCDNPPCVRACPTNLCAERLAIGKIPACVEEARGANAMVFGDLNDPHSRISKVLNSKFTIQRKPALGTNPSIFYII
ncbi:MAG: 4Fe-4S ferredoxin [Desulfobulbaceae bacterium]|nr:4Fe-4S ferredoxin [Desulfobulbaceae bacterium]